MSKFRAVGINHVTLEVGDIDAALAFHGEFLSFKLRGRIDEVVFVDLGDQFLAGWVNYPPSSGRDDSG